MQGTAQAGQGLLTCRELVGRESREPLNRRDECGLSGGKAPLAHQLVQLDRHTFRKLKRNGKGCGAERHVRHFRLETVVMLSALPSERMYPP